MQSLHHWENKNKWLLKSVLQVLSEELHVEMNNLFGRAEVKPFIPVLTQRKGGKSNYSTQCTQIIPFAFSCLCSSPAHSASYSAGIKKALSFCVIKSFGKKFAFDLADSLNAT